MKYKRVFNLIKTIIRRYRPIFYNIIPRFDITTNLTILSDVKC